TGGHDRLSHLLHLPCTLEPAFLLLLLRQRRAVLLQRRRLAGTRHGGQLELAAALLGPDGGGDDDGQGDDGGGDAHGRAVGGRGLALGAGDGDGLSNGVDDLGGRRRDHVADLVGDAGEAGAEGRRRQLVEVDGHDAPGALHPELQHEARGRQRALALRQDPRGDQQRAHERRHHDGAAAAEPLRHVADDGAADAGAGLHEDAGAAGGGVVEALLGQHEGGVAVLRGVAVVVEPGHEDDAVDDDAPLVAHHAAGVGPEGGGGDGFLAGALRGQELLRLGQEDTDDAGEDGQGGADPEDDLPGVDAAADGQVGAGGEDVAHGVALLQDAGHEAAGLHGAVLEGHGDGVAVHAAHEEAEQAAHGQELGEGGAVDGGDLQQAQHDHVEDHGPLAAPAVAGHAEDGGADGAQQQRQRDGGGDGGLGAAVVARQLDGLDGQRVEVEGVGQPREQADQEIQPVARRQLPQQPHGVLQRWRLLPLRVCLAGRVGDLDAHRPAEQVAQRLACGRQRAFGDGLGGRGRGHRVKEDRKAGDISVF
ncbi:hypothetical protein LOZ48_006543, partial [Ophidiomyces ophidiicola]